MAIPKSVISAVEDLYAAKVAATLAFQKIVQDKERPLRERVEVFEKYADDVLMSGESLSDCPFEGKYRDRIIEGMNRGDSFYMTDILESILSYEYSSDTDELEERIEGLSNAQVFDLIEAEYPKLKELVDVYLGSPVYMFHCNW